MFAGLSARADAKATHGMLLFGQKSTYASHLPMFHAPHDYQLLLRLTLEDLPDSATLQVYREAQKSATTYFTLVPEPFDLAEVVKGTKQKFLAKIYQGHFERGGTSLGAVRVSVAEVIYAMKLGSASAERESRYVVFGHDGEYFGAHLIQGQPSFDAIVSTSQPYQLAYQVASDFPCHKRYCPDPGPVSVPDSKLPFDLVDGAGQKPPQVGTSIGVPNSGAVDIQELIYFEEGDLADKEVSFNKYPSFADSFAPSV
jgi:hypothetical protein